jgi:hypothetical protein
MAKSHHFVFAAAALAMVLCACAGTQEIGNESRNPRLLGDWLITAIKTSNPAAGPLGCQPSGAQIDHGERGSVSCGTDDQYRFESNGNFVASKGGMTATGSWSTAGDIVTVVTSGQETLAATYTFTGNKLELSFTESAQTATNTFVLERR